jgi:hypothetical protein
MQNVSKRVAKALIWVIGGVVVLVLAGECWHHYRYGHFVSYGLHADIILGNSDVGKNDTYFAVLRNLSVRNYEIEGCRLPGGYIGSGILYEWDVQRFNRSRHDWDSLRGANNWLPQPFAWERWEGCRAEMTRLPPFSSRLTSWVFKAWVTDGDVVRMAIHTSVEIPADRHTIIFTPTFAIKQ